MPSATWQGLDLQAQYERLLKCDTVSVFMRGQPPKLHVKHTTYPPFTEGEACRERWHIIVRTWPSCTAAMALETLTHELAHFLGGMSHNHWYRKRLHKLVSQAFGPAPDPPHPRRMRDLDKLYVAHIEAWLASQP